MENNPAMFETTNQHTKAKTPVTKPDPSLLKRKNLLNGLPCVSLRSLVAERAVSNFLHTTISFACCWRQLSAIFGTIPSILTTIYRVLRVLVGQCGRIKQRLNHVEPRNP
jgi:hypothetical protein